MFVTHIKVPHDRIGAIIGPKGQVKSLIEQLSTATIDIDSENGTVEVIPGEDPIQSMRAPDVIQAIARGFNPEKAMILMDDEMIMLETIDLSRSAGTPQEMIRLKGRIIGKAGKTREIMESMIGVKNFRLWKNCKHSGYPEQNQIIRTAIEMLIGGATHGQVYGFLEKKKQMLIRSQL
jgi:ribosomal RNA assembly protein